MKKFRHRSENMIIRVFYDAEFTYDKKKVIRLISFEMLLFEALKGAYFERYRGGV